MDVVVIETQDESGCEWGVSFDGHNPELKDYVRMIGKDEAFKLKSLIDAFNKESVLTDDEFELFKGTRSDLNDICIKKD